MLTGPVDSSDSESDTSNRDSGHGTSEDDVPVRLDTFHPPQPKSHSSTLGQFISSSSGWQTEFTVDEENLKNNWHLLG